MDCYITKKGVFIRAINQPSQLHPSPPPGPLLCGVLAKRERVGGIVGRLYYSITDDDDDDEHKGWPASEYIVALWPDAFIVPSGRLTVRHCRYIYIGTLRVLYIAQSGNISGDIGMIFTAMRFRCNLSSDGEANDSALLARRS